MIRSMINIRNDKSDTGKKNIKSVNKMLKIIVTTLFYVISNINYEINLWLLIIL